MSTGDAERVKRLRFKKLLEEALSSMNTTVEEWVRDIKESRAS